MLRTVSITMLFLTLALAGCIEPPGESLDAASLAAALSTPAAGRMTGVEVANEQSSRLCLLEHGISLPDYRAYCADRLVRWEGEMSLERLPVRIEHALGDVEVARSSGSSWSFEWRVTANGRSSEDAEARLDDVRVTMVHESEAGHLLHIVAESLVQQTNGLRVSLVVTLPPGVEYDVATRGGSGDVTVRDLDARSLSVRTGSGDVSARGVTARMLSVESGSGSAELGDVRAQQLVMKSGSGKRVVDAEVVDVDIQAGSGDVRATLRPFGSGQFRFAAGSGDIDVRVPENAAHGYDVTARAGSGDASIRLKDGALSQSRDNQASFRTDGFGSRSFQTSMVLTTGSGDIEVRPL